MTPETLYRNQVRSLNSGSPVLRRREDKHVTEEGKKFQTLDNNLEDQAHLFEEL
jgi:hypothetical protein